MMWVKVIIDNEWRIYVSNSCFLFLFRSNADELDANRLIEKLGDLKSLEYAFLPDILKDNDDDDDLEEGGGLTLPATPLDSPSDSEVYIETCKTNSFEQQKINHLQTLSVNVLPFCFISNRGCL